MTDEPARDFVPAAGRAGLLPLYDAAIALTMRETHFRGRLVERVAAAAPTRVLEVGCGTGSLTVKLAAAMPGAKVVAIDPDVEALGRARAKDTGAITWAVGSATALDEPDGSVDAVVLSLVLHHLPTADKARALAEARRVLRPSGRLHVADWGRPQDPVMAVAFSALRALDGRENTRAHAEGRLAELIGDAGFDPVTTYERLRTGWGTLELLEARPR